MNINYHYFVIKTLALEAKFSETDAQKIAHYSQLVDDFDLRALNNNILVTNRPPDYFFENNYAKEVIIPNYGTFYEFISAITAIDIILSVSSQYQQETLVPFHFIPQYSTWKQEQNKDRTKLRCIKACECDSNSLILQWKKEIIENSKEFNKKDSKEKALCLVHIGMFLHTYADTYAHHGFSGLHGWENYSFIKDTTCKMDWLKIHFYYNAPSIGHANVGTLPDAGADEFSYTRPQNPNDKQYNEKIVKSNPLEYKNCSREIFNLLCTINSQNIWEQNKWDELYSRIAEINKQILKNDDETTNVSELTKIWEKAFAKEQYKYSYNPNDGIQKAFYDTSKNLKTSEINDLEDNTKIFAYSLSDEIFHFNECAYEHLKKVSEQNFVGCYLEFPIKSSGYKNTLE